MAAGAALLAVGCKAPQPLSSLTGRATHGSVDRLVLHDPTCPTGADGQHGTRMKWTARIAAADPKQWLRIDACSATGSALGGAAIDGGPFVIYTADGELRGTARGSMTFESERDWFELRLTIAKGTGVYAATRAGSTLTYWGCRAPRWDGGVLGFDVLAGTLIEGGRPAGGFTYPSVCSYPGTGG
jgi:hypothetical protein